MSPCFFCPPILLWTLSYQVRCHWQYISDAAPLQPCSSLDTGVLELLAILWCWTKIWSLHAGLIKHRHDSHVEQFTFWSKFWHLHQFAGVRNWKSLIFLTGQPPMPCEKGSPVPHEVCSRCLAKNRNRLSWHYYLNFYCLFKTTPAHIHTTLPRKKISLDK